MLLCYLVIVGAWKAPSLYGRLSLYRSLSRSALSCTDRLDDGEVQTPRQIDHCESVQHHFSGLKAKGVLVSYAISGLLIANVIIGPTNVGNIVRAVESPAMVLADSETIIEKAEDIADEVTAYATIATTTTQSSQEKPVLEVPQSAQSAGWERARQKRTIAVKKMAKEGMLKLEQDEEGNQMLSVPWIPNQKLQYKSLSLEQKLRGEVAAGAIGELAKDVLLHPIDTLKSRKQAAGKEDEESDGEEKDKVQGGDGGTSALKKVKDLYAGFPAVATSSLPQGGVFFLAKKGGIELIKSVSPPFAASLVGQAIPVGLGSIAYWAVRTPAEIVKVKVQLGQSTTVREAFVDVRSQILDNGLRSLWKFYPALLSLDIPYAIINFALYGIFNDLIASQGIEANVYTRLVSGVACGMIAAGITCPIDVAKTRIISRSKRSNEGANDPDGIDGIVECEHEGASMVIQEARASQNVIVEMATIVRDEGVSSLFIGLKERVLYVGLSNGIRLAAYSTSRMDLMLRSFDTL